MRSSLRTHSRRTIPWPMIVLGCGINHISYWCTNQSIMQRVLGAKNLKEAQKGSLLTGLTCVFCPIFLVAPRRDPVHP